MPRMVIKVDAFLTETVRCVGCQNRMGLNGARALPSGAVCCAHCMARSPQTETLCAVHGDGQVELVG